MAVMKDFIEKKFGRRIIQPPDLTPWDKTPKITAGHWLVYQVDKSDLQEVMAELKSNYDFQFNFLMDVTAVDWINRGESFRFKVIYQLLSLKYNQRLTIKVCLPADELELSTVSNLWRSALYMEREVWDMFGIRFSGHPDLRRILLYDEFEGHPLRKDYPLNKKQPLVKMRLPDAVNDSGALVRPEIRAVAPEELGFESRAKD